MEIFPDLFGCNGKKEYLCNRFSKQISKQIKLIWTTITRKISTCRQRNGSLLCTPILLPKNGKIAEQKD